MGALLACAYSKLWKNPGFGISGSIVSGTISFIFGSEALFWIFISVILMDMITGIFASRKANLPISSDTLRWKTFLKFIAYFSVLLVGSSVDFVVVTLEFAEKPFIHALAIGWVIVVESISILENSESILGHRIPLLRRLKKLIADVEEKTTNNQLKKEIENDRK